MKLFDSFKHRNRKAFTLVEVLVVVAILGILFIVLMASVNWSTDTARESGVQTDMRAYQTACNAVGLEAAGFPEDVKTLAQMLNKRLDPGLEVNALDDNQLTTDRMDPWGTAYRIGYNRPQNSKGQLTFTSAGPNTVFDDSDDIITVIRYEVGFGNNGNIVIENPKNDEFHTHAYNKEVTLEKYLYKEATCISPARYYYSCSCGGIGTEVFENGTANAEAHGDVVTEYRVDDLTNHRLISRCVDCSVIISEIKEAHKEEWENGTSKCKLCAQILHSHEYNQKVATDEYIKIEATCLARAVYYYSCTCGEAGVNTFEEGSTKDHVYTAQISSSEYLKATANCTTEAVFYKSCIYCGLAGTSTFSSGGYNKEIHIGDTTVEYVPVDSTYHLKKYTCSACNSAVKASEQEIHSNDSATGACLKCGSHTHNYNIKDPSARYLKQSATCTINASYYFACICGERGQDSYELADSMLPHDFSNQSVKFDYRKSSANCMAPAVYYYSCSCGKASADMVFAYGDIDPLTHKDPTNSRIDYSFATNASHTKTTICLDCNSVIGSAESENHQYTAASGQTCVLCRGHAHKYDAEIVDAKYLKVSATCTTPAQYFKSCSVKIDGVTCGESGKDTFEDPSGVVAEHNYEAKLTTNTYLCTYANCVSPATYYISCTFCGAASTSVFEYGNIAPNNHAQATPTKASVENLCTIYECCGVEDNSHQFVSSIHTPTSCAAPGKTRYGCLDCNYENIVENIPQLDHTAGPTATCLKAQVCTVCNAELQAATGHTPGATATCTTSQRCITCLSIIVEAFGHTPSAAANCETAQVCTTCNTTLSRALGHDYTGLAATCTSPQVCAREGCDKVLRSANGHVPGASATCTEDQLCTVCYEVIVAAPGHTFVNEPTCTTDMICTVCNFIGAYRTGHNLTHLAKVDPTCTETGLTAGYYCNNIDPNTSEQCSYALEQTEVEALGHGWFGAVPTCTTPQVCARVGCTEELLPALGHDLIAATCIAPITCSRCSYTDGNALGHVWTDATCTTPKMCSRDGCSQTLGTALGHNLTLATCLEPRYCQVEGCGHVEGGPLGHVQVLDRGTAATCTATGLTDGYHCSRCEEILVAQTIINALGHNYGEDVITKQASCTAVGSSYNVCSRCSDQKINEIPIKDHRYVITYSYSCMTTDHTVDDTVTFTATATCYDCSFTITETKTATTALIQEEDCMHRAQWCHNLPGGWDNNLFVVTTCEQNGDVHESSNALKPHNLTEPTFTWDRLSNCSSLLIQYTCTNPGCTFEFKETATEENGSLTRQYYTTPTCTENGSYYLMFKGYLNYIDGEQTASCDCGEGTHVEVALGHNYTLKSYEWLDTSKTHDTCIAIVGCSKCSYTENVPAEITQSYHSDPTCTSPEYEINKIVKWETSYACLNTLIDKNCCSKHKLKDQMYHNYSKSTRSGDCDTYKLVFTCTNSYKNASGKTVTCTSTYTITPKYGNCTSTNGFCKDDIKPYTVHYYTFSIKTDDKGTLKSITKNQMFKINGNSFKVTDGVPQQARHTCLNNTCSGYQYVCTSKIHWNSDTVVHTTKGDALAYSTHGTSSSLRPTHHIAYYNCKTCGTNAAPMNERHQAWFPYKYYDKDSNAAVLEGWWDGVPFLSNWIENPNYDPDAFLNAVWLWTYTNRGRGASNDKNEFIQGFECYYCNQTGILEKNIIFPNKGWLDQNLDAISTRLGLNW